MAALGNRVHFDPLSQRLRLERARAHRRRTAVGLVRRSNLARTLAGSVERGAPRLGASRPAGVSYQAFLKLLVRWTEPLRAELVWALQQRMEREFPQQFRLAGFVVLAADGRKIELPRTRSHEALRPKARKRRSDKSGRSRRRGRGPHSRRRSRQEADSPQLALTTLFHVGLRLPWDWRLRSLRCQRANTAARHARHSSRQTRCLTADCGFMGYEFWRACWPAGTSL